MLRLLLPYVLIVVSCLIPATASAQLDLILPTRNMNLYDKPEAFYMRTVRSGPDPWEGGMYGFSRNAKRFGGGTVYTRFHEGVDIAPTMRDDRGEPLDTVVAIDNGRVVYANHVAGESNYGKYVVVEHVWDGSPFYSLYAHLNDTWVDSGRYVRRGDALGRLGYTGAGINRSRAHVHFEITMLLNVHFQKWYDIEYGDNLNHHGYYNGMNLAGLNVARLYQRLREDSSLTIRAFLSEEHTPFYKVRLAREGRLDILSRYPWLLTSSAVPHDRSWEITFDASGLPLAIEPLREPVEGPTISWIEDSRFPYKYRTKYRVRDRSDGAALTGSGQRFIRLVAIEPDSTSLSGQVESPIVRDVADSILVAMPGEPRNEVRASPDAAVEEMTTTDDLYDTLRSPYHVAGYAFTWPLNGKRWLIDMQPIALRANPDSDDLDDAGVDTVMARCNDCARYGISSPVMRRLDETRWKMHMEVTDRAQLAEHVDELRDRDLPVELYIRVDDEESVSIVTVRPIVSFEEEPFAR